MPRKVEVPDLDNLIARYQAGASLKQLSDESGVCRPVLNRRFTARGIPIRGRSDAEFLKWSTLGRDRARVERQCSAAWAAVRGVKRSLASSVARARTCYQRLLRRGKWEDEFAQTLRKRGLSVSQQHPIERYNVDIALDVDRIAVEVVTAYLDRAKSVSAQRLEYLLDQGWDVIVLFAPGPDGVPRLDALAEKIHAFADLKRREPSGVRQYGVIRGNLKPVSERRFNLDGRTRIAGF